MKNKANPRALEKLNKLKSQNFVEKAAIVEMQDLRKGHSKGKVKFRLFNDELNEDFVTLRKNTTN